MIVYIIHKNKVKSVKLLNKGNEKSLVKFFDAELLIDNNSIYYSKNEAYIAIAEKQIIKDFKKNHTNKKGYGKCFYCKKDIHKDNCTVDHLKSLRSLGGRRELRANYESWKMAWDKSNLTLACEECNSAKNHQELEHFQEKFASLHKKAKLINMKKLKNSASECFSRKNNRKVGYQISTKKKNPLSSIYIAKSDSNILDKDLILNNKK
jgi:5-methylcytosine-specific restriction endonuclease McrA